MRRPSESLLQWVLLVHRLMHRRWSLDLPFLRPVQVR
jgi:hypothetical protein